MDIESFYKVIDDKARAEIEASNKFYESLPDEEQVPELVDLYKRDRDRVRDLSKKTYPRGASPAVDMSLYAVVDGLGAEGLAHAYRVAKEDIDTLKRQGERGRAEVRRTQYMDEHFLPAVEVVVNAASPDEVLNSKKALSELDKYVLLEGSGSGYTASYIRQAYANQLGQRMGLSDDTVRSDVIRINELLDNGQVRMAYSVAQKIKEKIDKGDAIADDNDYSLIGRVVAYYS